MATAGGVITNAPTPRLPPPPAGYTYEPNTGRLVPVVGSGQDVLEQRARQQKLEDEARQRTVTWETADRNARDVLRQKLIGMLDRPLESGTAYGSGSFADVGAAPTFNPGMFGGGFTSAPAAPATIGKIELPDTSAAQANIFARAKDKVGLQTQG